MMVFAGVGIAVTDDADADAKTGDLSFDLNDIYVDDAKGVLTFLTGEGIGAKISYIAILDEDFEEKITILNKEYYDAIKKYIKGYTVTVPKANMADAGVLEGLEIFTSLELNKVGDIVAGLSTKIVFEDVLATNVTYDLVDTEAAAAAIIIAVAEAVEQYADYKSPEEVIAAVEKAIAETKEQYKDYLSPEDAQKAAQAAVEQYIIDHPQKDDGQMWMIIAIFAIVAAVALGGFLGFSMYKGKKAKKETA